MSAEVCVQGEQRNCSRMHNIPFLFVQDSIFNYFFFKDKEGDD